MTDHGGTSDRARGAAPDDHGAEQPGPEQSEAEQDTGRQWHDTLFRSILSRPENAGSELRSLLSPELAGHLDLDHLELQPGTFVTREMRHLHTDLLFRTTYTEREAYVYVLIEHQSKPDPLIAFRMIEYQVSIWRRHIDQARSIGGTAPTRLPVIVPLVVYQGRTRWTAPTDLADLLDGEPAVLRELGSLIPRVRYLLDDLTRADHRTLHRRPLTTAVRLTFAALIYAPRSDIDTWGEPWRLDLRELESGPEQLARIIHYIVRTSNNSGHEIQDFLATVSPTAQEIAMTAAEQLLADGEAKGRAAMLIELLTQRFGDLDHDTRNRIENANLDQLHTWASHLWDAASLHQVLDA